MLTKDEIKKFENAFLSIGDEVSFRAQKSQKTDSVFNASPEDIATDKKQFSMSSSPLEDIIDHKEKEQQAQAALHDIFSEVMEEEGIDIDELQPELSDDADRQTPDGDVSSQEEDATEEDSVSYSEEDAGEQEIISYQEDDTGLAPTDNIDTDEQIDNIGVDMTVPSDLIDDSLTEDSQDIPETDPFEDIADSEEDEDEQDTSKIEDELIEDGEFTLPEAYLKNDESYEDVPRSDYSVQGEENVDSEGDEFTIDNILDEAGTLFDIDEFDDGLEEQSADDEFMFSSEEELEKEPERYRTKRDFTEDDEVLFFNRIDQYNIYLSQAIIQVLEDEELADESERLVDLILDDAKPQVIHHEVERLLKQEVYLFNDHNIYYADTLKKRLITFSEQLRKTSSIFITRVVPISALILTVIFYSYFFAYKPLKAWFLYEKGYKFLIVDEVEESEKNFKLATSFWLMDKYFFKYADLYAEKRMYNQAYKKYEQIIFGMNEEVNLLLKDLFQRGILYVPFSINGRSYLPANLIAYNKEAFLKAIDFQVYKNADFNTALLFFNLWIERFDTDKDILISFANMYIVMYENNKNKEFLDQAKYIFDKLVSVTNGSDESLLLRARWAIRAGDEEYLNDIIDAIFTTQDEIKINDSLLVPYLEIIKYRLQHSNYESTADILDILRKQYPNHIEIPYLYALYYSLISDYKEQRNMLLTSIQRFEEEDSLTISERNAYIDTRIRLAESYLYDDNNIIAAKESITKAQLLFEKSKGDNLDTNLYRLYFIASQIELLKGNINLASNYLAKSYNHGYSSTDMQYHMGLISFLKQDWDDASRIFSQIITENKIDFLNNKGYQKVLYLAIGNSLLMQKNYTASIMYYNKLLELLDEGVENSETIFTINLNKSLNMTSLRAKRLQIENNIGVALYYLSRQKPGANKNEALSYLQQSNTVYQNLTRVNEEYVREDIIGIPQANIIASLQSGTRQLSIYSDISYYLDNKNYWDISQKNPKALTVN